MSLPIYIDIETLRSPEEHRLQILEDVKANFKAPSTLSKSKAAEDLIDAGVSLSRDDIKFTSKDDMIARWEKELAELKSADVAREKWEKTSFDPEVAPIACICIGYNAPHGYVTAVFDSESVSEAEMLRDFHAHIESACFAHGVKVRDINFIGHYINKFDLPFIWKRSVINNVETCHGVKWVDARHGQHCYDTMTAWAGYGNSISMDRLAEILGEQRKTEGMDGSKVFETWQEDPMKVISYCHDDVAMVKAIHERLIK